MKLFKRMFLVACALLLSVSLVACSESEVTTVPTTTEAPVDVEAVRAAAKQEVKSLFDNLDRGSYNDEDLEVFDQINAYGNLFLDNASSAEGIAESLATVKKAFNDQVNSSKKYASGIYSFVASSYDERTEILGILEAYAYEHFLTGFSMIDDGGYTLYSTTVKRGVDTYVPGYGWATLSDGEIIADLSGETNDAWKRYYHTFETTDPGHINYADDKGSVVGDLVDYVASSYWSTRLNETNDGYEWYSLLANEKPQAVNANANTGLATIYEWNIKVGGDLKYQTLTTNETLDDFNGRAVAADDYLTMYKAYYTKALGWARSAENLDGAGSIKGAAAYYSASADGFNEAAWENVGIKVEEDADGGYKMVVEFNSPCTPFYAMYYMNSTIFSPVPEEFIIALGKLNGGTDADAWAKGCALFGKTSIDLGLSPVDTYLSLGIYTIEAWNTDEEIVFKRNAGYTIAGADRYKIAGVHVAILEAASTDIEAAWKELNAGKLSACGVPSTQTQDRTRKDDIAYAVYTPGSSNYKLNVNACDQELWIKLFGEEGEIEQTAKDKYWVCEPAMSNSDFLLGLSWSLDRETLAKSLGRGPSINYFGDGYLSDPENGVIYNTTEAHQKAMAKLTLNGEYPYGYNLEVAKSYFEAACEYFIAKGVYKSGDTIKIEIAWQTTAQFTNYGDPIIEMWESAFNAVGAEYGLTLDVENWAGAQWSDVYYNKMMVGQYDIGFGSISGNALNPLNFLEVLKSDNSSGFTLNWGADTSIVNLEYDGVLWSFDSLWQATETGGYFYQGEYTPSHAADLLLNEAGDDYADDAVVVNEDGTATIKIDLNAVVVEGFVLDIEKVVIDGYVLVNGKSTYTEFGEKEGCSFVLEDGIITFTASKAAVDALFGDLNAYAAKYGHYIMVDVYYANTYNEVPSTETDTVKFFTEDVLPVEEAA
ncbi:MAG: hypothetical protein K6G38_04915 [Gammaproteobacteria bacterium]|nr:hypothetical protein [Gammaproteobacteria bacterium]